MSKDFCFASRKIALGMAKINRKKLDSPPRTGWPPGMLQDDSRELSRWLASRPGARRIARMVADEIARRKHDGTTGIA